ncbi:MAG: SDR family NAD(P)-dependent oxidoreductase [Gammaproteobacteria bacterium]|nr:SDR family NAD(P)-dependent oxidoreductase [Gammaproteobacteria bacterium]
MKELSGKTALVTGASSGIGLAITQTLLAQQCRVIGIARDFSKVNIDSENFEAFSQDLVDLNKTSDLINSICKDNQIDYFIHSAGSGMFGSIEQFSVQQIDQYIKVNLSSALVLAHHIVPVMRKQKSGRIIFIGSESALNAGKKGTLYSSAKFGIRGLALSLREDCSKDGINVSLINPGMVKTPFFDNQNFQPGDDSSNYIEVQDIADTVLHIVQSNPNIVFDEINLSPRNKTINFS